LFSLAALASILLIVPRAGTEPRPSTSPRVLGLGAGAQTGCCTGTGVLNFGVRLDFNSQPDGVEITDQYRSLGVLFGHGVTPNAASTVVQEDYPRPSGCRNVLNGDPAF